MGTLAFFGSYASVEIFAMNVCNSLGAFFLLGVGICQVTDYLAVFQLVLDQLNYSKCKFSYLVTPLSLSC